MFFFTESADHDLQNIGDLKTITVNCSVAYMSTCMSMRKWYDNIFLNNNKIKIAHIDLEN